MPLAYALVARASDGAVLAQHSFVAGNFESVAMECLQRMQHGYDDKFTVNCDGYTFNYLLHAGYVFAVAADEAYGRQVPFACAQRVCDAWMEKFASKGRSAGPYGMDKNFSPVLKREMEFCQSHPSEMGRVAAVQQKVDAVKGVMVQNVESVLNRGDNLDVLDGRTDSLRDQAHQFQIQGKQLHKRMCLQSAKAKVCVGGAVAVLVLVIFLAACFGGPNKCIGGGGAAKSSVTQPAPSSPAAAADATKAAAAPASALAPGVDASAAGVEDTPATPEEQQRLRDAQAADNTGADVIGQPTAAAGLVADPQAPPDAVDAPPPTPAADPSAAAAPADAGGDTIPVDANGEPTGMAMDAAGNPVLAPVPATLDGLLAQAIAQQAAQQAAASAPAPAPAPADPGDAQAGASGGDAPATPAQLAGVFEPLGHGATGNDAAVQSAGRQAQPPPEAAAAPAPVQEPAIAPRPDALAGGR